MTMSHKKHNYQNHEAFYEKRLKAQQHLDGGALPIMDTDEIVDCLASLTSKQIFVLSTLLFNYYESEHKHIWYSKGVRVDTIDAVIDLVDALKMNQMFDNKDLHSVYTGLGVDDHSRKIR